MQSLHGFWGLPALDGQAPQSTCTEMMRIGQDKWRDRRCKGLPTIRSACLIQTAQSSSCSPSTRLNALTLWLTTVAPMASA